jgi:Fic family protein
MNKYHWKISPEINQLIMELESIKFLVNKLPVGHGIEASFRQHSLLKSAVFSARIEGFTDTLNAPKKESQNLLKAYHFVLSEKSPRKLSLSFIKNIHKLVLDKLAPNSGNWRTEPWAIFNQSGIAVYLAPPHFEVPELMAEYVQYINQLSDHPGVKAAVAQFIFEKIHPFADGNGRVGRLISAFILDKNGFGFRGLAPFEEYLDSHREDYYFHLESGTDCSGFIQFFLEALVSQSREYMEKLTSSGQDKPENTLLPRRMEILEIIRDHPECSFDFLKRRFLAVNEKTLHNDLLTLQKDKFIRKLGITNKVVYIANNQ